MPGIVKSAQTTIEECWPKHAEHTAKSRTRAPRWSTAEGIVCACGDVLGWPDPEHHETLSQYTKRVAQEQVDVASAPGRVKGAFGTYPSTSVSTDDPVAGEQRECSEMDDPGPEEPAELDWGEPPEDEPEPVVLTIDRDTPKVRDVQLPTVIEDGDSEDVGSAPIPVDAVPDERGNMISGGMSYGPVDEAQTESDLPPWEDVDQEPDCDSPPWASAANLTPEEAAAASAEGAAAARELIDNPEVGRALVPYAGTPIMPTEAQDLDPLTGRLAPLDPTLPYTPSDVELKIVEILRQLENSELFLRQQLARLHAATHNHDYRHNLAVSQSEKKAQDQRKAEAWLATKQENHEMTEAEMLVRALRDSQHNLRAQLSGFQSVARSLAVSLTNALDGRDAPRRVESYRKPPPVAPWEYQ